MRNFHRLIPIFLSVFLFGSSPISNAAEINVPLVIHEALREGVIGINRKREPVTVGLPFPAGMVGIRNGSPQLAVDGSREYQFRTLKKWPDGSAKWVLVDFQADVKAGRINDIFKMVSGNGTTPGKLAEDKRDMILIDTGAMQVEVNKKGFNLFNQVIVAGKEIVVKGASRGIVLQGEDETLYMGAGDHEAWVIIEENGPIRAVVRADGAHVGNGSRMLDYTVRMHFYKGKSRVRVFYTLRNGNKNQFEHAYLTSLDLITRIPISGKAVAKVSSHKGILQEDLSNSLGNLIYYQAVSGFPQKYDGDSFYYHAPIAADPAREEEKGFLQEGYWIWRDGNELIMGKKNEYPDLAFMDVSNAKGAGVTAGIRFAAGWWPKAIRARNDGTLEVSLWPREKEAGYWIRFGSHTTFEIMFDFHAEANEPVAVMKKFQYPLVAKAHPDWYSANSEGIYPLYKFLSSGDEAKFFKDKRWEYLVGQRYPKMEIFRYHYWGTGGPRNQHDFARIDLVNFLRETGDALRGSEYFLGAEARFNYNADWSIYHSDNYDLSATGKGIWQLPSPPENSDKAELAKVFFEFEHPHWYGLPLYYYLTGDERIKEAVMDWAEYVKKTHVNLTPGPWARIWGWGMYSLAAMYEFTGDKEFMTIGDANLRFLLDNRMDPDRPPTNLFIDWDRGYIACRTGYNWDTNPTIKPGLITGYAIFDGLYNYYLHMDEDNPLKEKSADVLEGLSEFFYREPYFEGTKNKGREDHWAFWLPYVYNLDDKLKSNHAYRLILQALYVNLYDYQANGGDRWLERMDKILRMAGWDQSGMWGHWGYIDHPGLQAMLYTRSHPRADTLPPSPVTNLVAKVDGKDAILSWAAPVDAVRYQIKYSTKKLVESLEFDPETRTYRYEPTGHANWWAGENVLDEPKPAKYGETQNYTLKGLEPGKYYAAIRSWDASNNRSSISNVVKVVVK